MQKSLFIISIAFKENDDSDLWFSIPFLFFIKESIEILQFILS